MHISFIADKYMPSTTRLTIGRYRHQVFVQGLQWKLPAVDDIERDEFDVASAMHVLVYDDAGALIGYARLLPTTQPYLLGTHFPHLVDGGLLPCSRFVWELSRFAASDVANVVDGDWPPVQSQVGERLLREAIRFVASQGGRQIVFCTTVAIERLAMHRGFDVERLGPPHYDGNDWLVAARIHCNQLTIGANVKAGVPTLKPAHPTSQAAPVFA